MGKLRVITRDEYEIENLDEVKERLHSYNLVLFDLIGNLRSSIEAGEFGPFYVLMMDASDPQDGYVAAPVFYLSQDTDDHGDVVYGPIKWEWTDGDQFIENWKDGDLVNKDVRMVNLEKDAPTREKR
jgi:hypothetical protein